VSTNPSRSVWRRAVVLVPVALSVVAAGAFGFVQWRAANKVAEARARLLVDVADAAAKRPPDGDELQRLMTQLKKLPDHETAVDVLSARAGILLARDQAEAAWALFGAVASAPTASAEVQGLGARILLRVHASGLAEGATATGQLEEVVRLAEASYRESHAPGDLLRAWLACERAGQHERSAGFAKQLAANHADSPEHMFVAFAVAFDPAKGVGAVDAAVHGLSPEPVEAQALRVFALLQANDLEGATRTAEQALARAAGVGVVRWAAAVAFHACALKARAAGANDVADWVHRRDEQLGWIEHDPGSDEALKQKCRTMRDEK
jgi:hypothetical protein